MKHKKVELKIRMFDEFYRNNEKAQNVTNEKLKEYFSGKKLLRMINIIDLIEQDSKITIDMISEKTGVTVRTIKRDMETLREHHIIERQGSSISGSWKVLIFNE